MDQLYELYAKNEAASLKLDEMSKECVEKLHAILYKSLIHSASDEVTEVSSAISPRPKTKRAKRLPSLHEVENEGRTSTRGASLRKNSTLAVTVKEEKRSTSPLKTIDNDKNATEQSSLVESQADNTSRMRPPSMHNEKIADVAEPLVEAQANENLLMPPPSMPLQEANEGRPKRLAKIKSEKNLKEPKLNQKLRRPSNFDASLTLSTSTIQAKTSLASNASDESVVVVPGKTPSMVDLLSDVEQTIETQDNTDKDKSLNIRQLSVKIKREKISLSNSEPSESIIAEQVEAVIVATKTVPLPKEQPMKTDRTSTKSTESDTGTATTASTATVSASATTTTTTKRTRKKKDNIVKPIKVERFSDIDKLEAPISSRTRQGSFGRHNQDEPNAPEQQPEQRAGSIYEDAVDDLHDNAKRNSQANVEKQNTGINNETITVAPSAIDTTFQVPTTQESTFILPNPNATITLPSKNADATFNMPAGDATFNMVPPQNPADATFNMVPPQQNPSDATFNMPPQNKDDAQTSFVSAKQSMETAKNTSQPQHDSLITEDESFEKPPIEKKMQPPRKVTEASKLKSSAKAYKMPTRTNELFDPLVQSPVKMKVKAFETAANGTSAAQGRPKRTKENSTPSQGQSNTPLIGKLFAPAVGRFLTPTQASNITPNAMANVKKAPSSASKAIGFPTTTTAASKGKTIVRENSAEDFRKGLQVLADERKKQREQKHLLAAQQREAKERERAERMAKLAKEREEKRIKKQLEAEQKKRELEEIQRKLRQQEENTAAAAEAAKMKAAKAKLISDQERIMLQQMKHTGNMKSMLPPPPLRTQAKYTFEMLHTDDSSDEEGKVTYKRPPAPTWSRSHVRGPTIRSQQYWPTEIIDNFFSVQPMTADLRIIFPNIDQNQLRRNSSVLWSTPPRYSELPTY